MYRFPSVLAMLLLLIGLALPFQCVRMHRRALRLQCNRKHTLRLQCNRSVFRSSLSTELFSEPLGSSEDEQKKKRKKKRRRRAPIPPPPSSADSGGQELLESPPSTSSSPIISGSQELEAAASPSYSPPIRDSDDSLKELLEDAKKMRLQKGEPDLESQAADLVGLTVKGFISNILLVDFVAVILFLLWFLVGAFSSAVFKQDAIQLAFNGIFEPIVQPALGILMLGSVAGGLLGKDNGDEDENKL